jgi:hypothetical protein
MVQHCYKKLMNPGMTMSTRLLETEDRHHLGVGLPTVDDNLPVVVGSSRRQHLIISVPMEEVWLA